MLLKLLLAGCVLGEDNNGEGAATLALSVVASNYDLGSTSAPLLTDDPAETSDPNANTNYILAGSNTTVTASLGPTASDGGNATAAATTSLNGSTAANSTEATPNNGAFNAHLSILGLFPLVVALF